jgi:hypothetical protein
MKRFVSIMSILALTIYSILINNLLSLYQDCPHRAFCYPPTKTELIASLAFYLLEIILIIIVIPTIIFYFIIKLKTKNKLTKK